MTPDNAILIDYWLDDVAFASRTRHHVPREGDEVRFKGKVYLVGLVVWIEDEERSRVAINISRRSE